MACIAGLAQLVEHLICNQRVVGSSPTTGTRIKNTKKPTLQSVFLFYGSNVFKPPNPNVTSIVRPRSV